jgi:hypothetical protein
MPLDRTRVTDFHHALNRIDRLLEQYEPKHKGAWKNQLVAEHLEHGIIHTITAKYEYQVLEKAVMIEEELASAACRALMALEQWLQRG